MKLVKTAATLAVAAALTATTALTAAAETTTLRIQTHFSPETLSGKMAAKYIDDIQTMSNGEISSRDVLFLFRCEVGRDI